MYPHIPPNFNYFNGMKACPKQSGNLKFQKEKKNNTKHNEINHYLTWKHAVLHNLYKSN